VDLRDISVIMDIFVLPTIKKAHMYLNNLNLIAFIAIASNPTQDGISNKNLLKGMEAIKGETIQQNEVQRTIKWLINQGFILKIGKKYQLSFTGIKLIGPQSSLKNQTSKIESIFQKIENREIHIPKLSGELMLLIELNFEKSKTQFLISELRTLNKEIFENKISGRTIAAILKISNYRIKDFEETVNLSKTDWRDTLMKAGFGNDIKLHESWIQEQIGNLELDNVDSNEILIL